MAHRAEEVWSNRQFHCGHRRARFRELLDTSWAGSDGVQMDKKGEDPVRVQIPAQEQPCSAGSTSG